LLLHENNPAGVVQKVLEVILTPQHKALIRVIDTICCGVKNPKQAFWTAPYNHDYSSQT